MPRKTEKELFEEYNRKANQRMAEHNRRGGQVRKPVSNVANASKQDLYDRAKFNSRKAQEVLRRGQPLINEKGEPTPAALQFRRWAEKVPRNKADLRDILARANRQKEQYRPDSTASLVFDRKTASYWQGYYSAWN